jgi:hypothetical protein
VPALVERSFRYFSQEPVPIGFKARASFGKSSRNAVAILPGVKPGMEPSRPLPLLNSDRDAGTLADSADLHAITDVPSLAVWMSEHRRGRGAYPIIMPFRIIRKPLGLEAGEALPRFAVSRNKLPIVACQDCDGWASLALANHTSRTI